MLLGSERSNTLTLVGGDESAIDLIQTFDVLGIGPLHLIIIGMSVL